MKLAGLAFFAALFLSGCASGPLLTGVTVQPIHGAKAFAVKNESGHDLHEVKLGAWIFAAGQWIPAFDQKLGTLRDGQTIETVTFNWTVNAITIDGRCQEGRIDARWSDGSPVPDVVDTLRFR